MSAADIVSYWRTLAPVVATLAPPRVLLLGVTPELYGLPWPEATDFIAADRSQAMIERVWPGPLEAVRQEDWTTLPLPDDSRDLALCDGGLHLLRYPDAQAGLVRTLGRVLQPGGLFVVRLFIPPDQSETAREVLRDLRAGAISNVNVLKLRLDMALQSRAEEGVRLSDVWDAFHEAEPDADALAAVLGWSIEHVESVAAYRDAAATYHFVTLEQVKELFCRDPGGFAFRSVDFPSYELGERCPIALFVRTS